jgi:hypothetical protein
MASNSSESKRRRRRKSLAQRVQQLVAAHDLDALARELARARAADPPAAVLALAGAPGADALHHACSAGVAPLVRCLLELGAVPASVDELVEVAAAGGFVDALRVLVECRPEEVRRVVRGPTRRKSTALHWAAADATDAGSGGGKRGGVGYFDIARGEHERGG